MSIQRRDVLKAGVGAAAAWLTGTNRLLAHEKERSACIPIGFQLYSLRGEFSRDVPGTLKKLADIGYAGVEFWGYGGKPTVYQDWTAKRLRKLLDECGLKCCGMHLSLKALEGDNLQRTVELNKTLGNPFLNVAAAKRNMQSVDSIKKFATLLSELAEKAKPMKMRVGYHCHPFDMERFGDKSGWEILFANASPGVLMQLDTGNCAGGGGDPIKILKEFPGRSVTIHIKEYPGAPWQPHQPKWVEIFRLCETTPKVQWYIVEQGGAGGNGFDVPRESLEKLKRMGK